MPNKENILGKHLIVVIEVMSRYGTTKRIRD